MDIDSIPDLEVIKLIEKRKRRFLSILLKELEEENMSDDQFKRIRKIVLDSFNSYTRGLFPIIGIFIEGLQE